MIFNSSLNYMYEVKQKFKTYYICRYNLDMNLGSLKITWLYSLRLHDLLRVRLTNLKMGNFQINAYYYTHKHDKYLSMYVFFYNFQRALQKRSLTPPRDVSSTFKDGKKMPTLCIQPK